MKNNPYLFYRLALCYIEQEFQKNQKTFKENNENDVVCKTIYNENCDEPAFKKRFLLVNQALTPSLSEQKEENANKETEENNDNDLISVKNLDLNEAIRALKECILIIKGYNSFNEQIYNTLKPLMNSEVKDIYDSAYLNLIFCLIRNEYYSEAIDSIEEFRENTNSINKYKFILDNYTIEAYLKLGEFEKALNILSKDNFSYENPDEKGTFFSNSNHQVYDEITYRLALYINLIKINILNNNFKEAEKFVVSVLNLLNYPTEKELPPYVINIIVFYFLSIGKNEEAVQIIKFRRIPKFYNN